MKLKKNIFFLSELSATMLVSSLPSRNETLVIAAKIYAEIDIKVFWSCPSLLDLFCFVPLIFRGIVCKKIFSR